VTGPDVAANAPGLAAKNADKKNSPPREMNNMDRSSLKTDLPRPSFR
jgi:hypothetical protein